MRFGNMSQVFQTRRKENVLLMLFVLTGRNGGGGGGLTNLYIWSVGIVHLPLVRFYLPNNTGRNGVKATRGD